MLTALGNQRSNPRETNPNHGRRAGLEGVAGVPAGSTATTPSGTTATQNVDNDAAQTYEKNGSSIGLMSATVTVEAATGATVRHAFRWTANATGITERMAPTAPAADRAMVGGSGATRGGAALVVTSPGNDEGVSNSISKLLQDSDGNLSELDPLGTAGTTHSGVIMVRPVLVSTDRDNGEDNDEGDDDEHGRKADAAASLKFAVEEFSEEDRASPTSVAALGATAATHVPVIRDPANERSPPAAAAVAAAAAEAGTVSSGDTADHEDLKAQLKAANLHRQKMAANLKKKRSQIEEAESIRKDLEAKVSELQSALARQQSENEHLRACLQKVAAGRDDVKNKLRTKNELLRELRAEKDEAERKLKRSEHRRALEQDLLGNYRKLAQHTGYFKWGKAIRVLESALEQHSASESSHGTGGGGGGANAGGGSNGGK
jgi:hypothetical protein